jgi:thiamine biosynthesis lipoprotein
MGPSANPALPDEVPGLEARASFRAFNTDIEVKLADWRHAGLLGRTEAYFHAFEARFSRFRPDSELSQFNNRSAESAAVSPQMADLLFECNRYYHQTSGIFDPQVIDGLEAAGYDKSFERLERRPRLQLPPFVSQQRLQLQVDTEHCVATLPLGLRLDLGGIGKGWAVDGAAELLSEAGGFLVDAGGDIYASGRTATGEPWRIDVANPLAPAEVLDSVWLTDQAIATSWTTRRRWQVAGGWAHHLIDPRTGLPSRSGVAGATVIAPSTTQADVFAKCSVILGPRAGLAFLQEQAVQGLLILSDGSQVSTPDWPGATNPRG